ncbi:branched-chain amino acid transaminase [Kitasatospora sp. NBC_00315]|uniref:branched-chain amino acid transaminase n=1 Tax=Kitasatospora sp. NBC_00315 TaxID=2975963 RepID=UPI00324D0D2B
MSTEAERRWVYHQGEFVRAGELRLSASVQALHYGTGVFEGIRAYWDADAGVAHLLKGAEHYRRLHDSARLLRLDVTESVDELVAITEELIRRNELRTDVYIRPLAYKLALEPGTPFGVRLRGVSTALSILALPMGAYTRQSGIRAGITSWRRVPDSSLPARAKITGAYANSALAVDQVTAAGYDDAIFLNQQGQVAEASTANIFVVRDGRVATPSADADILLGITRAAVCEILGRELELATEERAVTRSELYAADEIFLTGTGCEVVPVVELDGRPIGDGSVGPVTARVREVYEQAVRGALPAYGHWLTPVHVAPEAAPEELLVEASGR